MTVKEIIRIKKIKLPFSKKFNFSSSNSSFTRGFLAKLRLKAKRKNCWYRGLKQNERMLFNLTISVVDKVRSFLLAKVISQIVQRLSEALETRISRLIRTKGKKMTQQLSDIGQRLGCKSASSWVNDKGVGQFLVINNLEFLRN